MWAVPHEFWRFWAVAVPATVVTAAVWGVLRRVLRLVPIRERVRAESKGEATAGVRAG